MREIILSKLKTVRRSLSRKAIVYILFYAIGTSLTFSRNFIYASLLSPEEFGDLNKLILYKSNFLLFADAGMRLLAQKKLPIAYSQNSLEEAQYLITGCVFTFYLSSCISILLLVIAISLGYLGQDSSYWFILVIIYSLSQYLWLVFSTDLRSFSETETYAILYAARAILIFTTSLFPYYFSAVASISFIIWLEIIITFMLLYYMLIKRRKAFLFISFSQLIKCRRWLKENLKYGVRLLFLGSTVIVLKSLDKWIGIFVLSREEYGIYSAGLIFLLAMETVQVMVGQYTFPIISRTVGLKGHSAAYNLTKKLTIIFILLGSTAFFPITITIQALINKIMPQYIASIHLVPVFVLSGIFIVSNFSIVFCTLCNIEVKMSFAFTLYSAVIFIMCILLSHFNLMNYTPGTIAYIALLSSILLWITSYIMGHNANKNLSQSR